jgi:hypothetical protein
MKTLDAWLHLLGATPRILEFPHMELISGRDWEPPVLVGRGQVILHTPNRFEFSLVGHASDSIDTFHRIRKAHDNPYETFEQFRLIGTDKDGREWALGWTTPQVRDVTGRDWSLTGSVRALSTDVRNATVAAHSSAENVVELPVHHPMIPVIGGFTARTDGMENSREHRITVLGSQIGFLYNPRDNQLAISCPTSDELPHPFAENWLAEPFRIIFGQSVYPRLVARNFGDGRAMVSLRPSPGLIRDASYAALWAHQTDRTKQAFWTLYGRLLTFIARARDSSGSQNFEENLLTQHYEEIAQASRGTRWVWALTLASTIEGQTKMLVRPGTRRPTFDVKEAEDLAEHIKTWSGPHDLKNQAIEAVKRTGFYTATRVLADLRDAGAITSQELNSWKSIRNEVSHGILMAPWSQKEEDEKLNDLASLFHKLTMQIVLSK